MGKRIDQLDPALDALVTDPSSLWVVCDPLDGIAKKATRSQLTAALSGITSLPYVADGTEGDTLSILALDGKTIILIIREGSGLHPVETSPDSLEYSFDGTDITLGLAVNYAGERFLIIYV
jgi:hypothetical protein